MSSDDELMFKLSSKREQAESPTDINTVPSFLIKVFDILNNKQNFNVIAWNEDGTAFTVKDPNEFSLKILPQHFKHNNLSSFIRQLNMYDFHKTKNPAGKTFYHPQFLRDKRHLMKHIKRKGTGIANPEVETSQSKSKTVAIQDVNSLLTELQNKHDGIEARMRKLEAKNAEYVRKYEQLVDECYHATEKNDLLSKLINCLISALATQKEPTHELVSSETLNSVPLSLTLGRDPTKAARRLLLDSLKALKFNVPELIGQSNSFTPTMLSVEEVKDSAKQSAIKGCEEDSKNLQAPAEEANCYGSHKATHAWNCDKGDEAKSIKRSHEV